MVQSFKIELGSLGIYEVLIPKNSQKKSWKDAKNASKKTGKGYRLPLDFELEELFKSSLLRGLINNYSYWSGSETAHTRARSQPYRNGGDFRAEWHIHPGNIEDKTSTNYYLFVRKSNQKKIKNSLFYKILELSLYDALREIFHLDNYVTDGIYRSKIQKLYKDKKVTKKVFLTTMKWGKIKKPNLNKILKNSKKQLESKLLKLNDFIDKNNPEDTINEYLSNDELHIKGVSMSFITKHLHFSQPNKFLIYDKWMKNLHYAMLIDQEASLTEIYFNPNYSFIYNSEMKLKRGSEGGAYQDFITRFKKLYIEINKELKTRRLKPFKNMGEFEAFLFGNSEKKHLNYNPRKFIFDFIENNRAHLNKK
jgi:hypothetical protein